MIEQSALTTNLIVALHKAQGSLNGAPKDSKNPHFKNSYASLEAVIHAAKPALQANGLAFTQAPGGIVDGALEITTMLMHVSGQWLRSTLHVPLAKHDPQGVGSAITYGCRYALMAALGLPPVDDDAEAAVNRAPTKPNQTDKQIVDALIHAIDLSDSVQDLADWWADPINKNTVSMLDEPHKVIVRNAWAHKRADLMPTQDAAE